MNELTPFVSQLLEGSVSPRMEASAGEFLTLLAERTSRYTMGDSTSVRLETAERLAGGILYCVELAQKAHPGLAERTLKAQYEAGILEAERQKRHGRMLLKQAESIRPPVENIGFRDTLLALPVFFRAYDTAFFAQEIPCDIDYPLCHPVSESLQGAAYVCEYLRRLNVETAFLRRFPAPMLSLVYERIYLNDGGLLVNLYAPVAEAALGRVLAEKAAFNLLTDASDRTRIWMRMNDTPEETALFALEQAAKRVCRELNITGVLEKEYLQQTARALFPRLRALEAEPGYRGIFASSETY
ncbi:MAG: DUF6179 domain-containing protein [Clostridiaceae bacterium]